MADALFVSQMSISQEWRGQPGVSAAVSVAARETYVRKASRGMCDGYA
jgi:hypothetical protein